MQIIAVESEDKEIFESIRATLKALVGEKARVIEEEDFIDLQIIREARKTKETMALEEFFKSVENDS